MQKLKISDYIEILKYYNKPIPKINKEGRKMIRRQAEKIINDNICTCIKLTDKDNSKQDSLSITIH